MASSASHYGHWLTLESEKGIRKYVSNIILVVWLLITISATVVSSSLFANYYSWRLLPLIVVAYIILYIEVFLHFYLFHKNNDVVSICILLVFPVFCSFGALFITLNYVNIYTFHLYDRKSIFLKWHLVSLITQFVFIASMFTPWFIAGGHETRYGIPLAVAVYGGYIFGTVLISCLFWNVRDLKEFNKRVSTS